MFNFLQLILPSCIKQLERQVMRGWGRGVKGYWLLVSSTSSAEAAGCKEVKPARPAKLTKNPILKQSNCFCHTAVRSNKRESYLRQQYCGIIGLNYSNWGFGLPVNYFAGSQNIPRKVVVRNILRSIQQADKLTRYQTDKRTGSQDDMARWQDSRMTREDLMTW